MRVEDPFKKVDKCNIVRKCFEITGIPPEEVFRKALRSTMSPNEVDERIAMFYIGKGNNSKVKQFAIFLIRKWLEEHKEQFGGVI